MFFLDEDALLVRTTLIPPFHPIDAKFAERFIRLFRNDRKKGIAARPLPSLRALQARAAALGASEELAYRVNLLRKDHAIQHENRQKKQEQSEAKAIAEEEQKTHKQTRRSVGTRRNAFQQLEANQQERDRVVLLLGSVGEVEDRGHQMFVSRTGLAKHSLYCQERLEKNEYREYGASRTPAVALFPDDIKYGGLDMSFFAHLEPEPVQAFVSYVADENVYEQEQIVQTELDQLAASEGLFESSQAQLQEERVCQQTRLLALESACRARVLSILEAQCEEEVRKVREAHLRTVQVEMLKLRGRFESLEGELDRFFAREQTLLARTRKRVIGNRVGELRKKRDALGMRRNVVLPENLLPQLLVLSADLEAKQLRDDCLDLLAKRLPMFAWNHCLHVCSYLFSLFTLSVLYLYVI